MTEETVGTLNLKIARLEQRLKVLAQQQALSRTYPTYQVDLAQEYVQLQLQLRQLIQRRFELLQLSSVAGSLNSQGDVLER